MLSGSASYGPSLGKERLDRRVLELLLLQEDHVRQATPHAIEEIIAGRWVSGDLAWLCCTDCDPVIARDASDIPLLAEHSNPCACELKTEPSTDSPSRYRQPDREVGSPGRPG